MYRKSAYFKKVFASFAIVVALPMLVLCVMLYRTGVTQMYGEVQSQQRLLMAQACETLDTRLKEIEDIALTISLDQQLISLSQHKTTTEVLDGIHKLDSYTTVSSFIKEILIFPNSENMFYTSHGVVWPEVFLASNGFQEADMRQFHQLAQSGQTALHFFLGQRMLMYFQPIPLFSRYPTGCVVFMLDQSSFDGLFSQKYTSEYGSVLLLNEQNAPMYQMDALSLLDAPQLMAAIVAAKGDAPSLHLPDGGRYRVVIEGLERMPWRLVSVLPQEWIFARMHVVTVIVGIAGALLLACGLVIFFARRHYTPIRILIARSGITSDGKGHVNELAQLDIALRSLRENVDKNLYRLKGSLLLLLLQGEAASRCEVISALQSLGCLGAPEEWQVLALRTDIRHYASLEALQSLIEDGFAPNDCAHAACFENGDLAFCALLCAPDALQTVIREIESCMQQLGCAYAVGVSHVHPLGEARTAYLEAMLALESPADGCVRHIEKAEVLMPEQQTFDTLMQEYTNALRLLNDDAAFAALDEARTLMRKRRSDRLWHYYAFRFSETVVQLSLEDAQYSRHKEFPRLARLTALLMTIGSAEELWRMLSEITQLCLDVFTATKCSRQQDKDAQLMAWLDASICDPNLSLDAAVKAFGHSTTYWSRRFQELSGLKFSDLVWSRRLALVKEKLLSTDVPIKDIVQEVGYWNISSFSRRFKQEEGMTINQWRELEKARR